MAVNSPGNGATVVIGAVVAMFGILSIVTVALEYDDSPNTMTILGVLGGGMVVVFSTQLLGLLKAQEATAVARNTEQKVDKIHNAVNGELDARLRAAATTAIVAVMEERDKDLDQRIEAVVLKVLDTHTVSCKVPGMKGRS